MKVFLLKFQVYYFLITIIITNYYSPQPIFSVTPHAQLIFTDSNLPIIIIDTFGQTIEDENRIIADMKIIYNGKGKRNYLTDSPNNYNGRIAIELRGSASMMYPKKGYRLETQDASGNNLNVVLLGMPKENDWILYGPYDDQSLIRNVLAYRLSHDIGRYASRTRFCELVLNTDYRGIYVLMEKIKQDKNRVNISSMDLSATTGDAVTGGYIIKFDKEEGENVGGWWSSHSIFYQYHEPKADDIVTAQKIYIKNFMNQFENVMSQSDIDDPTSGYPHTIDVASFVDHFILSEFAKNIDAYRISFFMFKDRDSKGGKLHAGPIWDFNLSFGKTWYPEDTYRVDKWEIDHNIYKPDDWPKVPFWWERLGHDPEFGRQVETRYRELRNDMLQLNNLYNRIDLLVDTLAEARVRNFQRWPETANEHSYEQEILMLKQWIVDRIHWIEENLGKLTSIENLAVGNANPQSFRLDQNYPNPFNPATIIEYDLPSPCYVCLTIYDLSGRHVKTIVDAHQSVGHFKVIWNGTDDAGLSQAAGVYFCRMETDQFVKVIKLALVK